MSDSLAEKFNFYANYAVNFIDTHSNDIMAGVLATGVGATLTGCYYLAKYIWNVNRERNRYKKELEELKNRSYGYHSARLVQVTYIDTGDKNPDSGNNFHIQLRQRDGDIKIESLLPDSIQERAYGYVQKAIEACTPEEPLVFQHLEAIVPEDDYPLISRGLRDKWLTEMHSKIADAFNRPKLFPSDSLKEQHMPESNSYIVALVYDPEAEIKALRVLVLPENDLYKHYEFTTADIIQTNGNNNLGEQGIILLDLINNVKDNLRSNPDVLNMSKADILTGEQVPIELSRDLVSTPRPQVI